MKSGVSPYASFKNWLINRVQDSILDETVIKAISPMTVLAMFGSLDSFTVYLNDNFNNFKALKHDSKSFYNMLKQFSTHKKLDQYDFSYINLKKEKDEYKHVRKNFPDLKAYEIRYLVDNCKEEYMDEIINGVKVKHKKKKKEKK